MALRLPGRTRERAARPALKKPRAAGGVDGRSNPRTKVPRRASPEPNAGRPACGSWRGNATSFQAWQAGETASGRTGGLLPPTAPSRYPSVRGGRHDRYTDTIRFSDGLYLTLGGDHANR